MNGMEQVGVSFVFLEVVFVKMPLRLRKRKAKRREEYLLNRDYELESPPEFGTMLMLNKGGRLPVTCTEQIWSRTELIRGGDRKRILLQCELLRELNSDEKRASKREHGARVSN